MARYPLAFGHALTVADIAVNGAIEVALAGDPGSVEFDALDAALAQTYVPSLVLAGGAPAKAGGIALLADRPMLDGRATAYVCRSYVCERPVTDPHSLLGQLRNATTSNSEAQANADKAAD